MLRFTILFICFFSPVVISTRSTANCGPICLIYCQYGNVIDEKGCPICRCKKSPCEDEQAPLTGYNCGRGPNRQDCPSGSECVIGPADEYAVCCPTTKPSESTPKTPINECGPVCEIYCQYGNVLDEKGCPTCKCKESPCKDGQAPLEGYTCGLTANSQKCPSGSQCVTGPVDEYAVCCPTTKQPEFTPKTPITECGPVCAMYCQYGNVLDEKGCPTCRCKQSPCKDGPAPLDGKFCSPFFSRLQCPSGYICVMGSGIKAGVCCPRDGDTVTGPTPIIKPGSCPKPSGLLGPCIARCSGDQDCPGLLKCCGSCPKDCALPDF